VTRCEPAWLREGVVANIDIRDMGLDLEAVRQRARLDGHVQRAQTMLIAAGLSALAMVAVAGVLLASVA
jgi:hypothetical protein